MQDSIKNWGMMWLNMARRVILIKALLVALPIYQYALIQCPQADGINSKKFSLAGREAGKQNI